MRWTDYAANPKRLQKTQLQQEYVYIGINLSTIPQPSNLRENKDLLIYLIKK
jgi:hypothetical protein